MRLLHYTPLTFTPDPGKAEQLGFTTLSSPAKPGAVLEFETFDNDSAPPYAILSHTWRRPADEVSYQESLNGTGILKARYQKLHRCGEIAARNGFNYFWVDTCCIDKNSSEELSQAINSMFTWYKKAAVCYAYLSGVSSTTAAHPHYPTLASFGSSMWFNRGWTLQALIARRMSIPTHENGILSEQKRV